MASTLESTAEPRQYRIFNASADRIAETANRQFTLFPQLPPELRARIWTLSLPRQRWLRIRITRLRRGAQAVEGRPPYQLQLLGPSQPPNALRRVSREAREAFLAFYRVHLPLGPQSGETVQFCPEADILHLELGRLTTADVIGSFFHDALEADKKRVGVRNLAMGGLNDMSQLMDLSPSGLTDQAAASAATVLTNLRTFFAVISPGPRARNLCGSLHWPGTPVRHNLSVPVAAPVQELEWWDEDPRADISGDLQYVIAGVDPLHCLFAWKKVEENFGIARDRETRLERSYLLAIWPEPHVAEVKDTKSLVQYLEKIDAQWDGFLENTRGEDSVRHEFRGREADIPQVAGFWRFPAEAFGEVPSEAPDEWYAYSAFDFSQKKPGLGVFHLP
ncbi:hypothetical protein F5Y15DRAFT_330052 [Xylariaceae sp. FL0016]|nr:hypothetical protein F5Y15DRAFT_330052 [Xylariaceae sp. FL0016]